MKAMIVAMALVVGSLGWAESHDAKGAAKANNAFGVKLFRETKKETDKGNKFLSPVSAYLALSMAYNGATGRTRAEMESALAVAGLVRDDVNEGNLALLKSLTSRRKEFELAIANSLWAKKGFDLKDAYVERVKRHYLATLDVLDFALPSASKTINAWVAKATRDKISSIVPEQLPDELRLLIVNATYFDAKWRIPFSKEATRNRPFKVSRTKTVQVPMMTQTADFKYVATRTLQAVELPYGQSESPTVSFIVVKPRSLDDFLARMTDETLDSLAEQLDREKEKYGTVTMPSLELKYESLLNDALQSDSLGMKRAFTDFAELDEITDERVSISQVLQKTYLKVFEEGTIAAAVTGISVGATSAPPPPEFDLTVDEPYFLVIRDKKEGAVLFMGSIREPEGGKIPERK